MTGEYHFTFFFPQCGKKKALKTTAIVCGSTVHATTKKCGKCGYLPNVPIGDGDAGASACPSAISPAG